MVSNWRVLVSFFCVVCTLIGFILVSQTSIVTHILFAFEELDLKTNEVIYQPVRSVYFTGDMMLAREVERQAEKHGATYPFSRLTPDTSAFWVGNFEAAVPTMHIPTPDFGFTFSVPSTSISTVRDFGFTHLSVANNHSDDFGSIGLRETRHVLRDNDLSVFGAFDPDVEQMVTLLDNGTHTIALIGLSYIDNSYDKDALRSVFYRAQALSDMQIVYVHWGEEYEMVHNLQQEDTATWLVSLGADLIIGHHPHVVQDLDIIDDVPVFYSLGNFIFDQYFSPEVQEGLVLQLHFDDTYSISLLPITSADQISSPRFMTEEERDEFLQRLASESDENVREAVLSGKVEM